MSDQTNFKENILTVRKQGKWNNVSYFVSTSETLFCFFFNNRLFSHMNILIMPFRVLCINSELLQILLHKKLQPSVNVEG